MEQSFKCNPKIGFRGNIEAAMATVLLRHEDLREYDVQKILNAVRDDLKRMVKKHPLRKHRLDSSQRSLYEIVLAVCGWYRGEDGAASDSNGNLPETILSAGVLYRYIGSICADAFGLSSFRYAAGLRQKYAATILDTATDADG